MAALKYILYETSKKYDEISTIYKCVEKLSMITGCNIWMICLELNWFFTIRVECCNFLNLYGSYVLLNFLLINATDRSKISSNQHWIFFEVSLYPLSFFANTPFKALFDQVWINVFVSWNCFFSFAGSLRKWLAHYKKQWRKYQN